MDARANTWGEKVYFSTPVSVARKTDAKAVVKAVELVYRQDSDDIADCVVSTSISEGDEIRLASPFNIRRRVLDDVTTFSSVRAGAPYASKSQARVLGFYRDSCGNIEQSLSAFAFSTERRGIRSKFLLSLGNLHKASHAGKS